MSAYRVAIFRRDGTHPEREDTIDAPDPQAAADAFIDANRPTIQAGTAVFVAGEGGFFRYRTQPDQRLRAVPS